MPVLKCISKRLADVSYTVANSIDEATNKAPIYRFSHDEEMFVPDNHAIFLMKRWPKDFVVLTSPTDTPGQHLIQPEPYHKETDMETTLRKAREPAGQNPHSSQGIIEGEVVSANTAARTDEELTKASEDALVQIETKEARGGELPVRANKRRAGRPRKAR